MPSNPNKPASGCLLIAGIPFTLAGLFFAIVSLRSLDNPSFKNPEIGIAMGCAFALIGRLMMAAGFSARKSELALKATQAAYPTQPWMWAQGLGGRPRPRENRWIGHYRLGVCRALEWNVVPAGVLLFPACGTSREAGRHSLHRDLPSDRDWCADLGDPPDCALNSLRQDLRATPDASCLPRSQPQRLNRSSTSLSATGRDQPCALLREPCHHRRGKKSIDLRLHPLARQEGIGSRNDYGRSFRLHDPCGFRCAARHAAEQHFESLQRNPVAAPCRS